MVADLLLRDVPRRQQRLVQHGGVDLVRARGAQHGPGVAVADHEVHPVGRGTVQGRERCLTVGERAQVVTALVGEVLEVRHGQCRHRAVDRSDAQGLVVLVHEHGEAEVPRRAVHRRAGSAELVLEPEVGGVAVVTVGDERLGRPQLGGDGRLGHRVGDGPEPVRAAVERDAVGQRATLGGVLDQLAEPGRALVHEQDRLEVGLGGPHQHGAVVDRIGHHVLVGKDDLLGLVAEPDQTDQPADRDLLGGVLVEVERGGVVGAEVGLVAPLLQPLADGQVGTLELA